jgi:hypothetical protein
MLGLIGYVGFICLFISVGGGVGGGGGFGDRVRLGLVFLYCFVSFC